MAMKKEMMDELGLLNGWDINSVDPCTWNTVACSSEGYVVSLYVSSVLVTFFSFCFIWIQRRENIFFPIVNKN